MSTTTRDEPTRTRPIDPRFRARRIEVQRDQGRRRLRRVGWLAGVGAVAVVLTGLTRTPLLDVDHIEVSGALSTGPAVVEAASGVARGDRLTGVPLGAVAARIGALPWVATASVTRSWPGTVRIAVQERRAVAAVVVRAAAVGPAAGAGPTAARAAAAKPTWVLLDASGRQLAEVAAPPGGLPRLETASIPLALAAPAPARFTPMLEVAASVPPSLAGKVLVLRPVAGGAVGATVRLRNGETAAVDLGPPEQLDRKWLGLASVLEKVEPAGLGRIDLRVPSAPALIRR